MQHPCVIGPIAQDYNSTMNGNANARILQTQLDRLLGRLITY